MLTKLLNHNQIQDALDVGLIYNIQELHRLHEDGVIEKYDSRAVNPASLDIHLGPTILIEQCIENSRPLSYRKRERLPMREVDIRDKPYALRPGEFALAHTIEVFDFPDNLGALFRIKSSQGRMGIEHLDAGWVDPGFAGSLTLEFKLMLQFSSVELQYGDPIGQLLLVPLDRVSASQSYKSVGRYGGANSVEQVR